MRAICNSWSKSHRRPAKMVNSHSGYPTLTLLNVPTLIPQTMDYDLSRAVEYILSGEMATDKANQQSSNTSSGKKGVLNTVKQYYTRSKSPLKGRKSSPAPPEIINVSEDDYEDQQMRLALQMSLQDSGASAGGRS